MRIASIDAGAGPTLAVEAEDGMIVDLAELAPAAPRVLRELLELGPRALEVLTAAVRSGLGGARTRRPPDEVRFLPPIGTPHAVWCAALNYPTHVSEGNWEPPTRPAFFLRVAASLCGHREPIIAPRVSDRLDYEGELALVIGTRAHRVPAEEAFRHVAGYSCFNDGSVRDWSRPQITPGKNFTATGAFGPWLTTADEVPDIGTRQLTTRLNGKVMQQAKIDEMIFSIPEQIAYLSTVCELRPGDVVVTGTPGGVGTRLNPQVFLTGGDVVEVEVEGVGLLRNPVEREAD
ncbi:fumarylacetoacetate hydrolase family protein [Pseudonocardia sp. Cha107L01]|uniref:fumarylacetoacetate hydrolase family protein n=1 Tax=Pseudonocardia sp. Cha107L01 TaxID=3457576 RepID=UPI00403EC45E